MDGAVQFALRVAILVGVALVAALALYATRRYVARQRRLALSSHAADASTPHFGALEVGDGPSTPRILAFSSPYCSPCHSLQEPALRRVAERLGSGVAITTVDATEQPDLAARYRVMTLPATVVFDAAGHPLAVNYGFADAEKLLAQVAGTTAAPRRVAAG
ncbi:MAG TPA: thioredoxin family protein [Ktedonobacterales bacterium]